MDGGGGDVMEYNYQEMDGASTHFEVDAEYSGDTQTWTTAVNGENGVTISREPMAGGEEVTVRIPANGAELFARLKVREK